MQCSAVQLSAMQYSAVQCGVVQCSVVHCSAMMLRTVRRCVVLFGVVQPYAVHFSVV